MNKYRTEEEIEDILYRWMLRAAKRNKLSTVHSSRATRKIGALRTYFLLNQVKQTLMRLSVVNQKGEE